MPSTETWVFITLGLLGVGMVGAAVNAISGRAEAGCADGSPQALSIGKTCPSTGFCTEVAEVIELKPRLIVRGTCAAVRVVAMDHHLTLDVAASRRLFPPKQGTD